MDKTTAHPIPLDSVEDLDLDSHMVIEASAGTGKTHTIEQIVIELLRTGRVNSLDEILVVTFTEKATGELKDRIRKRIVEFLQEKEDPVFRRSLENFDTASIFTIHGFCNKVLRQFAFENSEQFNHEIIENERSISESELHAVMRDTWPGTYGGELTEILKASQFPHLISGQDTSRWEEEVLHLLKIYQSGGNNRLEPEPVADLPGLYRESREKVDAVFEKLSRLAGEIDDVSPEKSSFNQQYESLNIAKSSRNKRQRDIIIPLLKLILRYRDGKLTVADVYPLINSVEKEEDGFSLLNTRWKKEGPDFDEKMPSLPGLIDCLENLRAIDYRRLQVQLLSNTVFLLLERIRRYKKKHSLLGYDDLIRQVYESLESKSSPLRMNLQRKYRFGLVDEFQDTDYLQWKIFKNIFLKGKDNRLFIIGDPKQAIYGFRGADVFVYHNAKTEMISDHNARFYTLRNNWRSGPELIGIFNSLFSGTNWFTDENIDYIENMFPENKGNHRTMYDEKPLVVVDAGTCPGGEARNVIADFIADEIADILRNDTSIELNEIGILFRKWVEIEPLEKALISRGIPFSYYKREGLFQSKETLSLWYVLNAIISDDLESYKKALLTDFFKLTLNSIKGMESLSEYTPIDELFGVWKNLAANKNWGLLFQSIVEDTEFLKPEFDDILFERKRMNLYQVIQNLEIEAFKKNMTIEQIAELLEGLYCGDPRSGIVNDLHKPESEEKRITLLTIHSSKGLQFKIVFIAGGFTEDKEQFYRVYHNGQQRVIDIIKDDSHFETYKSEKDHEDERLFYVALTRAKHRLYVPVFSMPGSKKAGFVSEKLKSALDVVYNLKGVHRVAADSSKVKRHDRSVAEFDGEYFIPERLLIPDELNFFTKKIIIDSFTGLKRKQSSLKDEAQHIYCGDSNLSDYIGEDLKLSEGSDKQAAALEIRGLPAGTATGLLVHGILEEIGFSEILQYNNYREIIADDNPVRNLIREKLLMHMPFIDQKTENDYLCETAQLVWNALTVPVPEIGISIGAGENPYREMEFYCNIGYRLDENQVPGIDINRGILHGFIDLIFIHDSRYYICDWKSNFLEQGYEREELIRDMRERKYDLQYQIYSLAVARWLKSVHGEGYEELFGGIIYLYLRGVDPLKPGNGVFFHQPSLSELLHYEEIIQGITEH